MLYVHAHLSHRGHQITYTRISEYTVFEQYTRNFVSFFGSARIDISRCVFIELNSEQVVNIKSNNIVCGLQPTILCKK